MANEEFMSELTLDLSLSSYMILGPDSCDFYMLNTMQKPVKLTLKQEFNFNLSLIELIYLIIVKCIYN